MAADCLLGECNFVTQFVPGEKVENDEQTKLFLGQVTETFAEAGLGIWQINPRNSHAHSNLIRNLDRELIIIDLEFALVTPIPTLGQGRSAIRSGNIPNFRRHRLRAAEKLYNRARLRCRGHDRKRANRGLSRRGTTLPL